MASQRASITSYGLAALRITTTTSRVPRLWVMVKVVAVPSPIVETFTVPAKPVSVPGANLVPSNFRTWLVVAPFVLISIPSTNKVETLA
mgnify:CR=1 FL=1